MSVSTAHLSRIAATALSLLAVCAAASAADGPGDSLRWRLLGPFRAGWSTAAAGPVDAPDTFYFGAAGGGVWKSTDAGSTWHAVFDSVNASNIGALAVSASAPDTIYVGTGQITSRYDIAHGDGVDRKSVV